MKTLQTPLTNQIDNESDEDSDKEIIPTPKLVEKSLPRTSKRNGPDADPSDSWEGPAGGERSGRGGRRGGYGNDAGMVLSSNGCIKPSLKSACQGRC